MSLTHTGRSVWGGMSVFISVPPCLFTLCVCVCVCVWVVCARICICVCVRRAFVSCVCDSCVWICLSCFFLCLFFVFVCVHNAIELVSNQTRWRLHVGTLKDRCSGLIWNPDPNIQVDSQLVYLCLKMTSQILPRAPQGLLGYILLLGYLSFEGKGAELRPINTT